uniref:Uncharacterized protein n=1 Tax=Leersia perrieri TaxID=77586 RepID=A0A0D9WV19_9ORYZ
MNHQVLRSKQITATLAELFTAPQKINGSNGEESGQEAKSQALPGRWKGDCRIVELLPERE